MKTTQDTRRNSLTLAISLATCLAVCWGCGGGDDYEAFDKSDIKPADPQAHHHHHHHGEHHEAPHGGTLVALGDHEYHAEIVWDEDAKSITVYVLDGEAAKAVPINATTITLAIGTGDDTQSHAFAAQPLDGEPDGKSSRFASTDKDLFELFHDNDKTAGQIDLTIGDKSYAVVVTHDEHDHDHEHGKESADHKEGEKHDKGDGK